MPTVSRLVTSKTRPLGFGARMPQHHTSSQVSCSTGGGGLLGELGTVDSSSLTQGMSLFSHLASLEAGRVEEKDGGCQLISGPTSSSSNGHFHNRSGSTVSQTAPRPPLKRFCNVIMWQRLVSRTRVLCHISLTPPAKPLERRIG